MMPLYLLAVFGKNEKANVSAEEKNLLSKAAGDGWAGHSAEVELANAIKSVILGKTKKLKEDGFSKDEKNVLLIYENMPRPHIDQDDLIEKCSENLSGCWSNPITFDDIYIESGDDLIFWRPRPCTRAIVKTGVWRIK